VPIARRRAVIAHPGPWRGVDVITITPCGSEAACLSGRVSWIALICEGAVCDR
jgi:hypothetical protein